MDNSNYLKISDYGRLLNVQPSPAANSTASGSISAEYMYTIIGVYVVIIALVFILVVFVLYKRLVSAVCPRRHRHDDEDEEFHFPGGGRDELNQIADLGGDDDSDDVQSQDSNYTNLSLEPGVFYDDDLYDSDDTPPLYEHPPSYTDSEFE